MNFSLFQGSGWIVLKSMYSSEDVKLAKDIVYQYNKADNITMDRNDDARHKSRDEAHNKYNGLVWALFNKGRIFEKMAQHPVILNISNVILGESSIISSYAANTVLPGQGGQGARGAGGQGCKGGRGARGPWVQGGQGSGAVWNFSSRPL